MIGERRDLETGTVSERRDTDEESSFSVVLKQPPELALY